MADKKISELTPLTGALNVADSLPISDDSASQTKKISPKALLEQAFLLVDDDSIPASKVDGNSDLPDGSVDTAALADASVTAQKLADNSSGVVASGLPGGVRIGQVGVDTSTNKLSVWDGGQWLNVKAAGSINTITGDLTGISLINVSVNGDTIALNTELAGTTAAKQFLAGPTGGSGTATYRAIVGPDLPIATSSEQGAVVVNGGGLTVDGNTIKIDNSITATTQFGVVTHNAFGVVTGSRQITGADLPTATSTEQGAVLPGNGLVVDPSGALSIDNTVAPGTASKITYSAQGLVTAGAPLAPDDIPDIPGDKITGDTLNGGAIADRSIIEVKLADYSTCLVQEGQPSGDYKLGQFWFTPSTSQLRVYGRGSSGDLWLSVGFGALQAQNLRWAGTVNADTGNITTLTDIGVSEGLTAGSPVPTPSDELSGLYFVVDTAGTAITIPNVNGDLCTEGDWILYIDQAQGAIHLDIAAGGGGGGGASKLDDLTDVDLNTVEDQQFLQYDALSGMWKNVNVIDGGIF